MEYRKPTLDECRLISHLIAIAKNHKLQDENISEMSVLPLADGNMGSLRLKPSNIIIKTEDGRVFGEQVSDCCFKDVDGVEVIASLYLDQNKQLFELDIWKTDFSNLSHIGKMS